MRIIKLSVLILVCASVVLVVGCGPQVYDLRVQNERQQRRIAELESQMQTIKLKLDQTTRQLASAQTLTDTELDTLNQIIVALTEDLAKKKSLIASMQGQLLHGGASLPVELSTMLEDFANSKEMVTYDSRRGIVKFKSDLLFERGSDQVASSAKDAVKSLCTILNSEQGEKFDVIVAGHTDDVRIGRPATRAKHPTNWHLSAHRAISVMNVMGRSGIESGRMSIRGFGEFRPIAPNKANKKGNPKNRRVEIYIVAKGI